MAELITIARPYARAAFDSARSAGSLPAWSAFLARAAAVAADPQLKPLIGNPRIAAGELIDLLLELSTPPAASPAAAAATTAATAPVPLTAAQLQEERRNFLALLLHNGRLLLLPQIAAQFERLRADAQNVTDVEIASALALTDEQARKLSAALERRLGRTVRLHQRVDPSLLGGAIVHYGDYVIDGSLRRRVERLATALGGA